MKSLFQAIMTRFNALSGADPNQVHNAFYTALSGRLYNSVAPQGKAQLPSGAPYCVFLMVSGVPEGTFTEIQENVLIQFSLFDSESSAGTVCDNYEKLTELFDDCELSVSGYTHIFMQRESQQLIREEEDPGIWHYMVEYRILIEKDR